MSTPLRVLIAEDNPADAELVLRELRRAGFEPQWERVASEAAYLERLQPDLDIILSDFEMPQFGGMRALELLQERGLDVPFIIISGTIGEAAAVAVMKQGATDYLLKDRLTRLGQAVSHALEQCKLRRERQRTVEELRLFRALIDQSSDTFEVIDPETARFLDVNERGCAERGYSREEFLALRLFDLAPMLTESAWRQVVENARTTGISLGEGRHRRKDGTTFPVEYSSKWVHLDRDYIVSVVRDISARQEAEQALHEAGRFAQSTIDALSAELCVLDETGVILATNEAWRQFFRANSPSPWRAAADDNYLHICDTASGPEAAEAAAFAAGMRAVIHGERLDFTMGYACHSESEQRWFEGRVTRFPGDGPVRVVVTHENVTERKKLEQQLLRAQRLESIGTLAGGIAHDLNNVLSPIMMALDLLRLKLTGADSLELLDILGTSAQRGADMVQQVLSFARGVEGKRMEVWVKPIILSIEKIANDTFLKSIQVSAHVPSDLWSVMGDETQIHQVLLNLCVNARDAMPDGGKLKIQAQNLTLDAHSASLDPETKPGPYVFIQVEDSGTGIPPQALEKIFDPFFTTKEIGKGTGLGLSTSLGIVQSHGGFMRVHSEVGTGTKFQVYLPALKEASSAQKKDPDAELPRGHGELILIVDDEQSVRQVTQLTLEAFGYEALVACDGTEAVALYAVRGAEIAVVLTDMMMPAMDGPATIRVLLKLNPKVRIIGASGLSVGAHVAQATSLGVKHFLPKPYTAETLLRTLRQVLDEGA